MPERGDEPDAATERQPAPFQRVPGIARRPPRLAWTDASGEHAVTLTGRTVVGTALGVDVVLQDTAVSRLHAELLPDADGCWLNDLGSTNGTFVEEVRVASAVIPEGGRVRLGNTVLTLSYGAAAVPVDLWPDEGFGPLVGRSAAMRELFARVARVAPSDATVLITGETGTGKELVARAVHEASARAGQPFVVVDCASLPEHLLEAELFGHARGAFTGAVTARAGAIEAADGGTVFLDEIGEVPLAVQPKLLRALESRTVRRLGETAWRRVNVRFVSATHRDLRQLVNQGAFREDLYFRLAVVPIAVPPLRARLEDISLLIEHFVAERSSPALDPALVRELAARPWLGNVRELRNFVERALALGPAEALSTVATHAEAAPPPEVATRAPSLPPPPPVTPLASASLADLPLREVRERGIAEIERRYLEALLARHGRNINVLAAATGVDRSYMHRLLKRHGL